MTVSIRHRRIGAPRLRAALPRPPARRGLWLGMLTVTTVTAAMVADSPRTVSSSRRVAACAAAHVQVVFPHSSPARGSGPGALLWDGPSGTSCGGASALTLAPVLASDSLGAPRRLLAAATGPLTLAATTRGQVIAAVGVPRRSGHDLAPATIEGRADGSFPAPLALKRALSPVASATGYLGDVALAWTSAGSRVGRGGRRNRLIVLALQRHYAGAPTVRGSYRIGTQAVTGLRVALDYRSDALLTWSQAGSLRARFVPATGPPGPTQNLGTSAPSPPLAAVVSDDGRAIVAWASQHASTGRRTVTASIYLSISGPRVRFTAPRLLERFREPAVAVLPASALALVRLSTESVTMAWTGVDSDARYVVRTAQIGLGGPGPATVLSDPAADAQLGALAPGPHADAVAVWTVPGVGRAAGQASIAGRRLVPSFTQEHQGPVAHLSGVGPLSAPAAAIDPSTDRALVAWRADNRASGIDDALLEPLSTVASGMSAARP